MKYVLISFTPNYPNVFITLLYPEIDKITLRRVIALKVATLDVRFRY